MSAVTYPQILQPPPQRFGFAKLCSALFEYFLQRPLVVLGRCPTTEAGRSRPVDLALFCPISSSRKVSRHHAVIFRDESAGKTYIKCLSSKNGIIVDNRKISKDDDPIELVDSAVILIDSCCMKFRILDQEDSQDLDKPPKQEEEMPREVSMSEGNIEPDVPQLTSGDQ